MKCHQCNLNIKETNFCENCNIDVLIYNKIINISNSLYNDALNEALSKNLSYAIKLLNKSIYFNKNNYNSRNLLGLIYFHIGNIGESLKHWVISSSIKKENNEALKYLKTVEEDQKKIEILNNAIDMYNQSLVYIKQKNDDLAIIQLKKAIEISPNFLEAINLLSFCYLIQNKKSEAKNLILKVLKIDNSNSKALYYYKELFPKEQRQKKEENIITNKIESTNNNINFGKYNRLNDKILKKKFGESFRATEIVSFLVGIALTCIFMYILIIPGIINNKENKIIKLENNINNLEKKYKLSIEAEKEKIKNLEEEKNNLILENERFKVNLSKKEFDIIIKEANDYYLKLNYEKAAEILEKIDENILESEHLKLYEQIKTKTYKQLGQITYKKAIKEYNLKNYVKSKELFEKSLKYLLNETKYIENTIYYLGEIAEATSDKDLAIEYYKKLIDKYPNSLKSKLAKDRLNTLNNNKT